MKEEEQFNPFSSLSSTSTLDPNYHIVSDSNQFSLDPMTLINNNNHSESHQLTNNNFNSTMLDEPLINGTYPIPDQFNRSSSDERSSRHSRQSSVAGSETSETSHRSSSSRGGVEKRVRSTRLARNDASSPYSRINSERSVEELAQRFDRTMDYTSNDGSDWGEDDDEEEEEEGREYSNDDEPYLPGESRGRNSFKETKSDSGFEGEEYSTMLHGGQSPLKVQEVLRQAAKIFQTGPTSVKDKAKATFLQSWLGASYELCSEGNASRQALYGAYAHACQLFKVKPVNSAGFGKAVRNHFVDIKTRRLGQRGASRYHYCGIRPTNESEASLLLNLTKEESKDDPSLIANERNASKNSKSNLNLALSTSSTTQSMESKPVKSSRSNPNGHKALSISVPSAENAGGGEGVPTAVPRRRGAAVPIDIEPLPPTADFPSIEELFVGGNQNRLDPTSTRIFWREFSVHCQSLLDAVRNFRFDQFEIIIRTWWSSMDSSRQLLVQNPLLSSLIYRSDAAIYDEILEFLNSQLTKPMTASAFTSLRGLGEHMERIQTVALQVFEGMPFTSPKIELAARFGHLITRYLGLSQLIQALTGIVSNATTMNEMVRTWDTIDLESVKNQSALVSNCDHRLLSDCFISFKFLLQNVNSIEHVIQWLETCFETCLSSSTSSGARQISPRSLLLRWSFVASQIMRDLTLRSAPAFGSFQIFGLFFEEALSMKVLRKVALQITAINPSTSGTNVPFHSFDQGYVNPNLNHHHSSSSTIAPQQLSFSHEPSSSTSSSSSSSIRGEAGGLEDHLSLLDQFSPKTQQMFERLAEGSFSTSAISTNSEVDGRSLMEDHQYSSFSGLNEQPHHHSNSSSRPSSYIDSQGETPRRSAFAGSVGATGGELNEFDLIRSMGAQSFARGMGTENFEF